MKLLHEIIEAAQKQGQFRPGQGGPLLFSDPKGRFSLRLNGYWIPLPVGDISHEAGFVDLQRRLILTLHVREVPEGTPPKEAAQQSNALFSQWKGFNAWREPLADKPERFVEKTSYLRMDPNTLVEQTSTLAYLLHIVFKGTSVLVLLRGEPEDQEALEATIKEAARGLQERALGGMPVGGAPHAQQPPSPGGFPPPQGGLPLPPQFPQSQGGGPMAPYPSAGGFPPAPPVPPAPFGPPPGFPVGAPPGQPYPPPGPGGGWGAPPAYRPGGYPQAPPPTPQWQPQPPPPQPRAPSASPAAQPAADAEAILVSFPPLSASFALPSRWQIVWQTAGRARLGAEGEPGVLLVHAGVYPDLASLGAEVSRLCAERGCQASPTEALREGAATPQGIPVTAAYQGQDSQGKPLALCYRALRASHGTVLGILGIAEPGQIERLLPSMEELARSFRLVKLVPNQAIAAGLVGVWSQASGGQPGQEGAVYTFEAEGSYRLRRSGGQSPAGVEIRDEDAESGRYFVSQGALVLSSVQAGSRVLPMRLTGDALRLGGESFTRATG